MIRCVLVNDYANKSANKHCTAIDFCDKLTYMQPCGNVINLGNSTAQGNDGLRSAVEPYKPTIKLLRIAPH